MDRGPKTPYWFYAKHHGYGWGAPANKQGWLALLVFFAFLIGSVLIVATSQNNTSRMTFGLIVIGLDVIGLIVACVKKGEPLHRDNA